MNYENEEYVRLYIRDTTTWKLLRFEGQTVLLHMLRGKFDKAGVFDADGHELSQAVTAVTGIPVEIVEAGLERLFALNVWVRAKRGIVWPKYEDAQTCKRGDAERQRKSRAKRRAEALETERDEHHGASRAVTTQDANVTDRHDGHELSLSPSPLPSKDPPTPLPGGLQDRSARWAELVQAHGSKARGVIELELGGDPSNWPEVKDVCRIFRDTFGRSDDPRNGSDPRTATMLARFAEGYSVADLCDAVRGSKRDEHIASNRQFQTIKTILRDAAQVDKFRSLLDAPKATEESVDDTGGYGKAEDWA